MGCGASNPNRPIESHIDAQQEIAAIELKTNVVFGDIETISGQVSPAKAGNNAEELPIDSQRPVDTYGEVHTENFGLAKEDSEVCLEEAARPRDTEPDRPVPAALKPATVLAPPSAVNLLTAKPLTVNLPAANPLTVSPLTTCTPTVNPLTACTPTVSLLTTCTPTVNPLTACTPTVSPLTTCTPTVNPLTTCTPTVNPLTTCPPTVYPQPTFSLTLKEAFESLDQPTFPAATQEVQCEKAMTKRELVDELLEHLEDV